MRHLFAPFIFAAAGLLSHGNAFAQRFSNKLPVNDVNCAATFIVPPTNLATSENYETMHQFFNAQAVATLGKQTAEAHIAAAARTIEKFDLFEKMSQGRACAYKFLETNSFFRPVPPT